MINFLLPSCWTSIITISTGLDKVEKTLIFSPYFKIEVCMKIRKAVIPVAGLGTRFLPATKAIPKEMLTIVDRPTIQYIVEEAVASGIDQIVFVAYRVRRGKSYPLDTIDRRHIF